MSKRKSNRNIDLTYEFLKTLGAGTYGSIFKAKRRSDNVIVAVKSSLSRHKPTEGKMLDLLRNKFILKKLDSWSCTMVKEGIKFFNETLVLEYFPSDLSTYAAENLHEPEIKIMRIRLIMWQILKGVSFMHSKNIAHCDLKPGNILINENIVVKICDLGMAKKLPLHRKKCLCILTPGYRAPEILIEYEYYDKSIDIWSVGVIMTKLFTGKSLIKNRRSKSEELRCTFSLCGKFSLEFLNKVARKKKNVTVIKQPNCERILRTYLFSFCNDLLAIDLIDSMLKMDPDKRITADQALLNDFFNDMTVFA